MVPVPTSEPVSPAQASFLFERAPLPMAAVEGSSHIVRYINPAFCRLMDMAAADIVGKSFCDLLPEPDDCVAVLDSVYQSGKPSSYMTPEGAEPAPIFTSCSMWPMVSDGCTVGVMIQVMEAGSLHGKTLAMNEALLLGSLRQHELTAAADLLNVRLEAEIRERQQRELDALMLTHEISHRVKNNLQIVSALINAEISRIPAEYRQGYVATQARIGAISELYDLVSQSSRGSSIPVDSYLRQIADSMTASLLGSASGIEFVVQAEALSIDPDRAVPFGLMVNELGTNAVKYAFPAGIGRVTIVAKRIDDQMELTVVDNGVGMLPKDPSSAPGRHGSDYVAIFVRQLGGTMAVSAVEGTGTLVRIRLPLMELASPVGRLPRSTH